MQPHVLIVDDHADSCDLLEVFLGSHGFRVSAAADALTALDVALRSIPDIVLVDICLPGTDGWGLHRCLKNLPNAEPRVIVTSAAVMRGESNKAFDMGAYGFFAKPLHLDALLEAVIHAAHEAPKDRRRLLYDNGDWCR